MRLKEIYKTKELDECTFKPQTNIHVPLEEDPQQRLTFLYEMGIKMNMERKDKTQEDLEIEKFSKECTFHPQVKR